MQGAMLLPWPPFPGHAALSCPAEVMLADQGNQASCDVTVTHVTKTCRRALPPAGQHVQMHATARQSVSTQHSP